MPSSHAAAPRSAVATPPAGARCLVCGYDLAGLDVAGVCPECAKPIEHSLRGNLLRYASQDYVRTLRRGAVLVFVAWLIAVFGDLIAGIATVALRMLGVTSIAIVDVLFDVGKVAAMLVGWWMLSSPDPAFIGVDDSRDWRVRLRWMLPFASVLILAETTLPFVLGPAMANTTTIGQGPVVFSVSSRELFETAAHFAHAVVLYAGLRYITALSLRFPSPKIRKEAMDAAACLKIILISGVLMVIFGIGQRLVGFLSIFAIIAAITAGITAIIWLILFLIVMGRLQSQLGRTLLAMERGASIGPVAAPAESVIPLDSRP